MTYLAAIILSFTVPVNETIQVHISRNIVESGRQEIIGIITDSNLEEVACSSRFHSPSLEVLEYISETSKYTLALDAMYDPASVKVDVYVVPRTHLDADGYYWYEAHQGYVYQVEDTSDLVRWSSDGKPFRALHGQEWIRNETGITKPRRFKSRQMYRVKVRR